jgi:hypothetical protein
MKGQIVFFLEVKIEKGLHRISVEKIYGALYNNLILSSMAHDQEDTIGLILASEDVFKIESIRSQIEFFEGVKEANIFLPIRIDYNQELIVNAIEQKITKLDKITVLKQASQSTRKNKNLLTYLRQNTLGNCVYTQDISRGSNSNKNPQ